ncbi:MAG: zinc-binding dehydrogenase [Acidobacteriota bacterium]
MKAIVIHRHGGLDQVGYEVVDRPVVRDHQVLVRTRAAALNHLDLFVLGGIPGVELEMPHVPGSDGAGVVEAVGGRGDRFDPGDRVMLNACLWCGKCEFCIQGEQSLCTQLHLVGEHGPGTFAGYFLVPEANLEKIPEGVTFEEAAAFSLVFQTAWRMLQTQARIRAGDDVFIHGIGGGVSTAALQITKLAGGRAFVSSSSDRKLEEARRLGADFCFNYSQTDPVRSVLRLTEKRGVDIVVDNVGNATWKQSLKMVRKGGRIVTCGATTGPSPRTEIRLIFWKQIQIFGSTMSNCLEYRRLIKLLGLGKLKPVISHVLPLSEGKRALELLADQQQFGKIVLKVED